MRSLIKSLTNSNFARIIRNNLNIKPLIFDVNKINYSASISDAFAWRTDNGFKTKFKFSDILNLFYQIEDSWVEIHFYSKKNVILKKEKIGSLSLSNEFEISSEYLNGIEDYGVFYIYHFSKKKIDNNNLISNRCYLGFSKNNNLFSFVHGNTLARYKDINNEREVYTDIIKTSNFKNQSYKIQKYFVDFDLNELFFVNPTSKKINFSLNKLNYKLDPGCSQIIKTKKPINLIKSNCLFLRPIIFSYKNDFMDVHHS